MKKTKRFLSFAVLCLFFTAGAFLSPRIVYAEEAPEGFYGERHEPDREMTAMDENGNIYETEKEDGTVEGLPNAAEYDETTAPEPYAASGLKGFVVNFNTGKSTVTEYTDAITGTPGYTYGAYAADAAYLGKQGDQVKFMLSGVTGLVPSSQVQVVPASNAASVSYYKVSGGWLYHCITTNVTKGTYSSTLKNGYAPSYMKEGVKYYSYDGHYFYTAENYGTMQEDYKAGVRNHAVNASSPYYNYFQYLPLRSTTGLSIDQLNAAVNVYANSDSSKMRNSASIMLGHQYNYGTNALLVTSIAANESAWGKSNYAVERNNLFGLNAYDSDPDRASYYPSVTECVRQFSDIWMSQGYLDSTDWRYFGGFLGNKASGINVKYASDPYWGEKAAAIAWQLGSSDAGRYTLAVKAGADNANVCKESNGSSTILYKTGSQLCSSYLVAKSGSQNGYYKIQSDPVLNSGRTAVNTSTGKYDIGNMYAYISSDSVTIINQGSDVIAPASIYPDVHPSDWFYAVVLDMKNKGIMTGMATGNFEPATNLSRAHFVTTLYRIEGEPSVSYSPVFPDVPENAFYTDPVLWANSASVATGYLNGKFGPADSLTREQMVTMLYRYAKYKGMDTSARNNLSGFPDSSKVTDFAQEAMQWAVAEGIISGQGNGTLDPQGHSSRAVCATVLTRFLALK